MLDARMRTRVMDDRVDGTGAASAAPAIDHALELAAAGWAVFPLHGKVPALSRAFGGRGLYDATTDLDTVAAMFRRFPGANIGLRVPDGLLGVDVDPYHGGDESLARAEAAWGTLPVTLTSLSGRGDGSRHMFFVAPPAMTGAVLRIDGERLPGIDLRVAGKHYLVAPPSIHPDTGMPYRWEDVTVPVAELPAGWRDALRPVRVPRVPPPRFSIPAGDERPGVRFARSASWGDVLEPHGWTHVATANGVGYWRRPHKSSGVSATTNALGTDRLHVFTSSASPLEPDTSYSKFGAYAALNHGGDFAAAARELGR